MVDNPGFQDHPDSPDGNAISDGIPRETIHAFQVAVRAVGGRPESFWERQQIAIMKRVAQPDSIQRSWQRRPWAWACAAIMFVLGISLFFSRSPQIQPDFAVGADQQLLIDVERALDRDLPAPLEPGVLLQEEMLPRVRILAEPEN